MAVGLLEVDEDDLPLSDPLVKSRQRLDVGGPLVRVGLAQQLLDLLEGRPRFLQGTAAGVAAGAQAQGLQQVLPELLDRPEVAGQSVLGRFAVFYDFDDLG